MKGYGKTIKIKHNKKYKSFYAHLSKIYVKKGQKVIKGQIIGLSGATGFCVSAIGGKGAHLHFGLERNGEWVDPLHYIANHAEKEEEKKEMLENLKKEKEIEEIENNNKDKKH